MSTDERLINALTPVGLPIEPNVYTGTATEYIVYNYNDYPELFCDNSPEYIRSLIQVHLYLPQGKSPLALKRSIRKALAALCETYPEIINASDSLGQHYVFEAQLLSPEDE